MRYPLRTLSQIKNFRRATAGKLGAEQIAICDTCDGKWPVQLDQATEALGENATADDLKDRANCPHCSGGKAGKLYVVINDKPLQRPIYFPGLFDKMLDGTDTHATEKPPRRPRR